MAIARKLISANGSWTAPAGVSEVKVIPVPTPPSKIITLGASTFIVDALNNGWGVGLNANGQLGSAAVTTVSSPVAVVGGLKFQNVYTQPGVQGSTYWLDVAGNIWSVGFGSSGVLGNNSTAAVSSPTKVVGGIKFRQFPLQSSQGSGPAFGAIDGTGNIWMWGSNGSGILGNNSQSPVTSSSPIEVVGNIKFQSFSLGGYTTSPFPCTALALDVNGNCWGWGTNSFGSLGNNNNTITAVSSPVQVVGSLNFQQIVMQQPGFGGYGLTTTGLLYSWGNNSSGQLGTGNVTTVSSPVAVVGGLTFLSGQNTIAACPNIFGTTPFVMAIDTSNNLWGWGINGSGQLGNGNVTPMSSPVQVVGGIKWAAVWCSSGPSTFGLDTSGNLWSWGANTNGQLGQNTTTAVSSPVKVVGGLTWSQVFTADTSTVNSVLASDINGTIWGWGINANGQLGNGANVTPTSSPVQVVTGLSVVGPSPNNSLQQAPTFISVVPGVAYNIVVQGLYPTFNGVVVGQFAQQLILEFDQ